MSKTKIRKSLVKPRSQAFSKQKGLCYYCEQSVCTNDLLEFASKYHIPVSKAKILECTGEHLVPFKDGGGNSVKNIVAACWFCNQGRHQRKAEPTPDEYKDMVQRRLSRGRWHELRLVAN